MRPEAWCNRCQMHYRIGHPKSLDFAYIAVGRGVRRMLLVAAREFDDQAESETPGELYTAVDFVDWLMASLREEAAA